MCIECSLNRIYPGILLCVIDRKVWKGGGLCPTCGQEGLHMGIRWRPPRLTDEAAWRRIEQGDYLWERPKTYLGQPTHYKSANKKPSGFGRYIPLEWRQKHGQG